MLRATAIASPSPAASSHMHIHCASHFSKTPTVTGKSAVLAITTTTWDQDNPLVKKVVGRKQD
jgi:hypothetical protein